MKIIKTIRTHSEPINTLLICRNGNLVSGSMGHIVFHSKENLDTILRITEFKGYYISHINELHKNNNFLICHIGFTIIETTNDNKKYKVLYHYYERFIMNKSIEFKHIYETDKKETKIKYNILISTSYGINIFEESNNEINENNKNENSENSNEKYKLVKKVNENELTYNIFQINNDCFVSTSNSVLASGNNCLRFWSYPEMTNIKTINHLFCSSGIYSIIKFKEKLLVGLEKIPKYLVGNKTMEENLNKNGIAVIDLAYNEIVQLIETHNCIRSILLAKNDTIIAGSTFKLIQYKFSEGILEKLSEKELFNYINNAIVEIKENNYITGSNNKLIIVIK